MTGGAEGFAVVVAHKPQVVEGASDERESVEGVGWFHGLAMRGLPVKNGFKDALAIASIGPHTCCALQRSTWVELTQNCGARFSQLKRA